MPLRTSDGKITVDVDYYYNIALGARQVAASCAHFSQKGGFIHVGTSASCSADKIILATIPLSTVANHG